MILLGFQEVVDESEEPPKRSPKVSALSLRNKNKTRVNFGCAFPLQHVGSLERAFHVRLKDSGSRFV